MINENGASRALLHTAAKLYYINDLSQVEIARRLGVSTATVSRLIRRARADGVVRIDVPDLVESGDLGDELVCKLGLKHAVVVDTLENSGATGLANAVGGLLTRAELGSGSVVAIGWGRAVRQIILAGLPRLPGVITIPANGGMQETAPHFQINEFVRIAAEQMGGAPRFLHAPFLASMALREAFLSDPGIRETVALWNKVSAAVVGVGLPHAMTPGSGQLRVTPDERVLTHAVGDVVRHYFDIRGQLVQWEGAARLIAISPDQLRSAPLVIGVAVSPEKAGSILGAIRSGMINALVTDVPTAAAVIDAEQK